jgi:predicted MFS family arabinose efflux permease
MRRLTPFLPFFFLIPVLLLLMGLPSQLHDSLPYHISTFSYIASIFGWFLMSCAFFTQVRSPKWSRLFFLLIALGIIVNAGYNLWTGQNGLIHFLFELVVAYITVSFGFPILPLIRRKIRRYRRGQNLPR